MNLIIIQPLIDMILIVIIQNQGLFPKNDFFI